MNGCERSETAMVPVVDSCDWSGFLTEPEEQTQKKEKKQKSHI